MRRKNNNINEKVMDRWLSQLCIMVGKMVLQYIISDSD